MSMNLREAICGRYTLIYNNLLSESVSENDVNEGFGLISQSWLILATAAGCNNAIERAVFGLSYDQLERKQPGVWGVPQSLDMAVNAIATYDPRLLVNLSKNWKRPEEVTSHFYDFWWRGTWLAALRHLKAFGSIEYEDVQHIKDEELQREVALLWPKPVSASFSWRELVHRAESGDHSIEPRQYDGYEMVEQTLVADDIMSGWGSNCGPSVPQFLFRALRGRAERLEAKARLGLLDLLKNSRWDDEYVPMVLELCEELHLDTEEARSILSRRLTDLTLMTELPAPRAINKAYLPLLGNWHEA